MREIYNRKINELLSIISSENSIQLNFSEKRALIFYLILKRAIKNYKSSILVSEKKMPPHQNRLIQNIKPILADLKKTIQDPTLILDPYKFYFRLDKAITTVNDPVDFNGILRAFFINNDFGELGNLLAAIINDSKFKPSLIHSDLFRASSKEELDRLYEEKEQFKITIENLMARVTLLEKELKVKTAIKTEPVTISRKKDKEKLDENTSILTAGMFAASSNSFEMNSLAHSSMLTLPNYDRIVFARLDVSDSVLQFHFLFKDENFLLTFIKQLEENLGFSIKFNKKGKMLSFSVDFDFQEIVIFSIQSIINEPLIQSALES